MKKSTVIVLGSLLIAAGAVYLFTRHRVAVHPQGAANFPEQSVPAGQPELGREFLAYPEQFPKALSFMPASFDSAAASTDASGKSFYSISYRGESSPQFFGTLYRERLEKEGWSVFVSERAGTVLVRAEHEHEHATVTARPVDARISAVQIIYYPAK